VRPARLSSRHGELPGAGGGWAVAVQGLGLVRAVGGGGPVAVQDQGPAHPVNHHLICDTRSHVLSELVEEVWLMPGT
jgi:hypothetical protein